MEGGVNFETARKLEADGYRVDDFGYRKRSDELGSQITRFYS